MSDFFIEYQKHVQKRQAQGIPPLALNVEQAKEIVELLKNPPKENEQFLLSLLSERINPGVDPAAQIKADFLLKIVYGETQSPLIQPSKAIELLGTMVGGYNLSGLIKILDHKNENLAKEAAQALKKMVLSVNSFDEVKALCDQGNPYAKEVMQSWASAQWFVQSEIEIPENIKSVVYKVDGEINTDDFSPASQAFTRADIPLHSTCMGGVLFPNGPKEIQDLKAKYKLDVTFVGDVVGTGSSRKSACNSLIWHIGKDIPFIPNKRRGGVIMGATIAPIFFNTAQDSGALPITVDVSELKTGSIINIKIREGKVLDEQGKLLSRFEIKPNTLLDEYKAGGRVNLIIGKQLTQRAREYLGLSSLEESNLFTNPHNPTSKAALGYTLAQKMVGRACGLDGILPGTACLPKMTTVGSQDTTGPMTANEMTELACLKFNADLVMQSFCHTAAYPKPSDVITHATLPEYISNREGVSLRVGDGVIHSWLNRLLIPDTVGTGGDSHTRFPIGISFPAGSGLVAFAAALGVMPLDMPESVLVRFQGKLQAGLTLRDVVNMIPYAAIKQGLLTVEKKNKKNIFAGRILEIEGLSDLKVEQAFELTDASAERSAAACTIKLDRKPVVEYLQSNVRLMQEMIKAGYKDPKTLERRIKKVQEWIDHGQLMEADSNAQYAAVININLNEMTEPIVACPNDPDDVKTLSEVQGDKVHEVFIGSCMTNIGLFRAASEILKDSGQVPTRLWICPPTRMDEAQLREEGHYAIFAAAGARMEIPGCSLCMGNQARVADGVTVFSTSTRNFNNRMGKDARVYLGSSELAAVVAVLGKMPTKNEYLSMMNPKLKGKEGQIYQYLNFNLMDTFKL